MSGYDSNGQLHGLDGKFAEQRKNEGDGVQLVDPHADPRTVLVPGETAVARTQGLLRHYVAAGRLDGETWVDQLGDNDVVVTFRNRADGCEYGVRVEADAVIVWPVDEPRYAVYSSEVGWWDESVLHLPDVVDRVVRDRAVRNAFDEVSRSAVRNVDFESLYGRTTIRGRDPFNGATVEDYQYADKWYGGQPSVRVSLADGPDHGPRQYRLVGNPDDYTTLDVYREGDTEPFEPQTRDAVVAEFNRRAGNEWAALDMVRGPRKLYDADHAGV